MRTINTYYNDHDDLNNFVQAHHGILLRGRPSVLAQIFSGLCDRDFLISVARQIRQLIPGAQVIGATTNGEIMDGAISGLRTVISFSVFNSTGVKAALVEKAGLSDFDLGRSFAGKLDCHPAGILIMFSTSHTVNATQLLNGAESINPDLPVAGGNAGNNFYSFQTFVLANEECTDSGVAGAVLYGEDLTVTRHSHLGWQPIGKELTVTSADGPRVYSIDNLPAYQVYRRYLGADETFHVMDIVEFPLVIQKDDLLIARVAFRHFEDDSLLFFGDIDQGEKVRFSFGHINLIREKHARLMQRIKQSPVESIFVYSCAARRSLLCEMAEIETLPLQRIAPTAGFFTAGEFFHANRRNQFLNHTMTIVALSEKSSDPDDCIQIESQHFAPASESVYSSADLDTQNSRGTLIALTNLIGKVTVELNTRGNDLESQRHDFINHLHTLYGLIILGETEQAMNYIDELYNELKVSR